MTTYPQTVSELYPSKWLKAADLARPVTVKIEQCSFEQIYNQRAGEHEPRLVIAFTGCKKRLITNKTQCQAIAAIVGSDAFADWPGQAVTLAPGRAHNGKQTIIVSRPAPASPAAPSMPQQAAIPTAQEQPEPAQHNYTEA